MANIKVAGDMYETLTGQLFELGRQLRQSNGYPFDPSLLKAHLQAAIEGRFGLVAGTFRRDMRKEGWTLLENVPHRLASAKIGAVSFLKGSESYINGEEMVIRARTEFGANYGQEDAEWLLEHQAEIPVDLQKYYLVFPGTVWQDSRGVRDVPYLDWNGDQWILNFNWLDDDFRSSGRLVRPRR